MKKYIFNLGVVASLVAGGISVASATPTNGTVNVTGSLQASTCSVSVTPSIEIPALAVATINNAGSNNPVLTVPGPKFVLTGCNPAKRVFVTLKNGSPASPDAGNIGLFTYDGNKDSAKGPIYFKYFPNSTSTTALDLTGLGQQSVNGDSKPFIKIYKLTSGVAQNYSGGYRTSVTMSYVYR